MKIYSAIIFFAILINVNIGAQNWTLRTKAEILAEDYRFNSFPYSYNDITKLALNSKEFYYLANKFRDSNDYTSALKNYEIALSMFDWGAFYYQYGVCLMDMEDYENAEKAFKKAINRIHRNAPYTMIAPYHNESGKNPIYSFDNNGIVRELYFSYYNLACIYSLTGVDNRIKIDTCTEHICLAIENGYPYLNHILTDPDLENYFKDPDSGFLKGHINQTYADGMINTVSGKTFVYRDSPNGFTEYEFTGSTQIKRHDLTSDDRNRVLHGTYEVKNYHIIIKYNRETGEKGHNAKPGGGVITIFENYVPYDRSINRTEYISLTQMAADDWTWTEKK